jgi:hypothetical protein
MSIPLDAEGPDRDDLDPAPADDDAAGRPERPLGRGLEEVSYLFLSRAESPSRVESVDPQPAADRPISPPPPLQPAPRPGVAVFRRGARLAREQLTATLRECRTALDPDVRAVATGPAAPPHGDIDLIAVDRVNRLTIIDVETTIDERLLLRGLAHLHWMSDNLPNVKRMYPDWMIDVARSLRLFLVAPEFPPLSRHALVRIASPAITCFRYHEAELSGRTGVLFEQL